MFFKEVLRRLRPDVYVSKEFSMFFLSSLEEQQSDQFKVLANALIRHPVFYGEGLVSKVNEDNVVVSYMVVRVEYILGDSFFLNLETFSSETGVWMAHTLETFS
ncbi:hypothetical protein POM88_046759 [Heracleum sosnowskyi]|uniref:F-box protein At3g26010-like beta-propeller domain-containing protein n=1 Tax=Heracleum sosnowskyi TaxID=360622 RepID=A0AAD8H7I5_9APIA|nr:hypothetical protein POM88_046759 [Heracleum sosnowskyi]